MKPSFAKAVDPVFRYVLDLMERIEKTPDLSVAQERQTINEWIAHAGSFFHESRDWDYAKFALVCWIDEVLIRTPWAGREFMRENTFEQEHYGTRDRARDFYVKSEEAKRSGCSDALEVYYICVVLGFRGIYDSPDEGALLAKMHNLPPDLEAWARQTSMAIHLGRGLPPLDQTGLQSIEGAPPLTGIYTLIWGGVCAAVLSLAVIVVAILLIVPQL